MRWMASSRRVTITRVSFVLACSLVMGCGGGGDQTGPGGGGGPPTLTSISVAGNSSAVMPGDSVALSATGHYSDGSTKGLTDSATWSSSDTAAFLARDASGSKGHVIARTAGSATITASYLGKSGTELATVASVTSVTVTPNNGTLYQYRTLGLRAQASFSSGQQRDVTALAQWTSADTALAKVASVSDTAFIVGAGGGSGVTISASYGGMAGNANLLAVALDSISFGTPGGFTVFHPAGDSLVVAANAYYGNAVFTVTSEGTWSSSNPAAATVGDVGAAKGHITRVTEDSSFISLVLPGDTASFLLRKTCKVLTSSLSLGLGGGDATGQLVVDGNYLDYYDFNAFLGSTGGSFFRIPKAGGSVQTLLGGIPFVASFAVDTGGIFWQSIASEGAQTYYVVRLSKATGVIDTILGNGGLGGGANGIAVDANYVYWSAGETGGIRRAPKTGGGTYTDVGYDTDFVAKTISVNGGFAYGVSTYGTARVDQLSTTTTAATRLTLQAQNSRYSAVDANNVYWVENGRIASVSKSGGNSTTLVSPFNGNGLVLAGNYVYYGLSGGAGGGIFRVNKAGGTPELVTNNCSLGSGAGQGFGPMYLAADNTWIYFTDKGGSDVGQARILRVRR